MPRPHLRTATHVALLVILVSGFTGCRYRQTTNCPTPAASGLNTRDLIDPVAQADTEELVGIDRFLKAIETNGARRREELLKDAPPGRPERNVLCLSGGGSFGAFSAGVLCGWTESGTRPTFDVVTGISTGSLIAPFAFLGPAYDAQLKEFYTTVTNDDIFKKQMVRGLLGGEAFTDTAPLRKKVGEFMTPQTIAEIAAAHQAGRRLIIGTTEEEGSRFIHWNIGEIACRNGPKDRDLIVDVMVASASIPGVFPPVKIDVYVDGKCYTERHVDGGVSAGMFYHPPYVPPDQRTPQTLNPVGTNVYIVVAGKLFADPGIVKPDALTQAGRAVSSVLSAQSRGDIQRMWSYCQVFGMNFHMTAIPAGFENSGNSAEFDPKTMSGLFEEGRRMHYSSGWRKIPPLTDLAQGELPQMRSGRCLTFIPKGPQLPISGPKGMKVQPRNVMGAGLIQNETGGAIPIGPLLPTR